MSLEYGSGSPSCRLTAPSAPRGAALVDLYLTGELLLDDIISHRIGLPDLDEAFGRLRAGEGARSVLVFDP